MARYTPLQQRRDLFELYAANLKFYESDSRAHGRFACPICLKTFLPASVEPGSLQVDLAHIFPKACGGNAVTLLCKKCNSRLGSQYDSHLAIEQELHEAFSGSGKAKIKGKFAIENAVMSVNFSKMGKEFCFHVPDKGNNPATILAATNTFKSFPSKFNFEMSFKQPDDFRRGVAILAAAYLTLFRNFGYEYLACESQWIRDILKNDQPPKTLPHRSLTVERKDLQRPVHEILFHVGVIRTHGMFAWGVPIPLPGKRSPISVLLLPGPGKKAEEEYAKIVNLPEAYETDHIDVEIFDPFIRLADPLHVGYMHQFWDRSTKQFSAQMKNQGGTQ